MSRRHHVSLDLETLGSGPHAAVVAIGAAEFSPVTGEICDTFYAAIAAESAVEIGGRIEPATVIWWLQQENDARQAIVKAGECIKDALSRFAEWLPSKSLVWGNGAGFDNARLREAYWDAGLSCPYHFRDDMDMRTLVRLMDTLGLDMPSFPRMGTHHNALDDAVFQAGVIAGLIELIRRKA